MAGGSIPPTPTINLLGFDIVSVETSLNYISKTEFMKRYRQSQQEQLKRKIASIYDIDQPSVYLTNNGRSAIYLYLSSLGLSKGTEVLVQAFTCNAVINPILWLGLTPRYVDISEATLSMDPQDLKKKIGPNCGALILQHTFGYPAQSAEVINICEELGIPVIVDSAHRIGSINSANEGNIKGDAVILSFGLEKVLSSRVGGALITSNPNRRKILDSEYEKLSTISAFDTGMWLLNPLIWSVLRRVGSAQKSIRATLTAIGLLNPGYYISELTGEMPSKYPRKLSSPLAKVVNRELLLLQHNLEHRLEICKLYSERLGPIGAISLVGGSTVNHPLIRFPVILPDLETRDRVYAALISHGFYIGRWYDPPVYPKGTSLSAMKYQPAETPVAESISQRIINLPTGKGVDVDLANRLCDYLIKLLSN